MSVVGCLLAVEEVEGRKVGTCGFLSGLPAAMPVRALPVFPGSLTFTPHSGLFLRFAFRAWNFVLEFKGWRRGLGRREKRCPASISGKLPPPAKHAIIIFKATCPDFRWFSGPGRDARAAGRMGGTPAGGAVPRGLGRAKPVKIKSRPGGDREEWNRVLKRSLPHTTGAGEIRTQLVTSFLTMERASSIPPKLW